MSAWQSFDAVPDGEPSSSGTSSALRQRGQPTESDEMQHTESDEMQLVS